MYRLSALLLLLGPVLTASLVGSEAWAQETELPAIQQPRQLAPGVLTVIPRDHHVGETYSGPLPLVEIVRGIPKLDWTPNLSPKSRTLLEKSKQVTLRRDIWCLEFTFKPMRTMYVDVPQPSGKMQRKLIWYMVYRVKNVGYDLRPEEAEDDFGNITYPSTQRINAESRRFFPHFVLTSHEHDKEYLDRVIPAAQQAIQRREMRGQKLYNTVEMTKASVPLSQGDSDRGVWGVVTWEDVDPRIDFFSVYIKGLSNAYQFEDPDDGFQPGDPPGSGRTYKYKTLVLHFWRPGDEFFEHQDEIHYGIPVTTEPHMQQDILKRYGVEERVDHSWIYR